MKAASTTLQTFLAANQTFVMADLYTFTLPGGTVYRYSGAGVTVSLNGNTYPAGARFVSHGIKQKAGIQVDSIDLDLFADARHTINGVPMLSFIRGRGFDQALVKIERAFAPDWSAAFVGSIIRFSGRLSEVQEIGKTSARLVVNSGLEVLDVSMPVDVYQTSCLNTVYDAKCAVSRTGFQASSTVSTVTSAQAFKTGLSASADYYDLGTVLFTSGANSGQRRTIKTQAADGTLTLAAPFPVAPAVGDALQVWPGCDLSQGRCSGFFNNLANFRGQPYIPIPETIMGGVGSGASSGSAPPVITGGGSPNSITGVGISQY